MMRSYRYSVGLALGALLIAGCGSDVDSPSLPGLRPPTVNQVAVERVRFLPVDPVNNVSQSLQATDFAMDFINPEFLGVQVRSGEQGSGTAGVQSVVSKVGRLQSNPGDIGQLAIQLFGGPILISAFAPNDAPLSASVGLSASAADGTVVPITVGSGQPLNLNTNSLTVDIGTSFLLLITTNADGEEVEDNEGLPIFRLEVDNILTDAPQGRIENLQLGDTVTLEGTALIQAGTTAGVQNLVTGEVSTTADGTGDLRIGAVLEDGRFSGTFTLVSCAPTNCLSL